MEIKIGTEPEHNKFKVGSVIKGRASGDYYLVTKSPSYITGDVLLVNLTRDLLSRAAYYVDTKNYALVSNSATLVF